MSLLERVIIAHRCRSTHHFIAMDALTQLKGPDHQGWRDLIVSRHEALLDGAKAPDTKFKDFKNHVLHVGDNNWGGAPDAASGWYDNAVRALSERNWSEAVYALGVMSHYYADPIQPFHTGQTEEEGAIHRAVEWSIAKSRDRIEARIAETGYPEVEHAAGENFVAEAVVAGAQKSHPHYQTLLNHYNIHLGAKNPPAGLDQTLIEVIAELVAYATSGLAALFERAFAQAGVAPPKTDLTLKGYLATLDIPLRWVTKKMADLGDRHTVETMYKELLHTGKVVRTLPDDDKAVRKLHAKQVLKKPIEELDKQPLRPLGGRFGKPLATPSPVASAPEPVVSEPVATVEAEPAPVATETFVSEPEPALTSVPAPEAAAVEPQPKAETSAPIVPKPFPDPEPVPEPVEEVEVAAAEPVRAEEAEPVEEKETPPPRRKPRLHLKSRVEEGPSIGKKTAARLNKIGIVLVEDLLAADPEETSKSLNARFMTAETIRDWQDQARLMMGVAGLKVHDTQILVGAGIRNPEALAEADPAMLLKAATEFLKTPQGSRVVWGGDYQMERTEVEEWIDMARTTARA